jgi:hypothetical protein
MQADTIPENTYLKKAQIFGNILFYEDKIQIHAYGPDIWVDNLIVALDRYGVKLEQQFRSPCG